jgi:formylglycine-generating enzyme required for sulfatase activity
MFKKNRFIVRRSVIVPAFILSITLLFTVCGNPAGGSSNNDPSDPVEPRPYTVTFNTRGGSDIASQIVTRGGRINEPPTPAKTSCSFGGWYKEAACTHLWDFAKESVSSNITLYAGWYIPPEMARLSDGTFLMGGDTNGRENPDELPMHMVHVTGFYMGRYQVTQSQYEALVGSNPSSFTIGPDAPRRPVERVTWYDCVEFCNKLSIMSGLTPVYTISQRTPAQGHPITGARVTADWENNGYRLPTEAEWEYACRAGTTTAYSTGNNVLPSQANFNNNITDPVGSYPQNPWGLYDMHGNVWEWCWDIYGHYSAGTHTDPKGPSSGSTHVTRGGSWASTSQFLRSSWRANNAPSLPGNDNNIGFRLARSAL